MPGQRHVPHSPARFPPKTTLLPDDDAFLDQMQAANFCFFWDKGTPKPEGPTTAATPALRHPTPGSLLNTAPLASYSRHGSAKATFPPPKPSSAWSSPFALSGRPCLTIADSYLTPNINNRERIWDSEISSVDPPSCSAACSCPANTSASPKSPRARQPDLQSRGLALALGRHRPSHGWLPEIGLPPQPLGLLQLA